MLKQRILVIHLNIIDYKVKMVKPIYFTNKIKNFDTKEFLLDGDKSLSIRWALMASLALGKSRAHNLLMSEDVLSTIKIFKKTWNKS